LIERSQFAHNPRCYVKGGISALKEHGFDGSWLQWFLKETETFQGERKGGIKCDGWNTDGPQPKLVDSRGESYKVTSNPLTCIKPGFSPDETPFSSDLPEPILPSLNYPKILHPNTVNVNPSIIYFYVHNFVPRITQSATLSVAAANRARGIVGEAEFDDDGNYGSAANIDVEILQAISKRVHYGGSVIRLVKGLALTNWMQANSSRNRSSRRILPISSHTF
jgi:chorismate mutase